MRPGAFERRRELPVPPGAKALIDSRVGFPGSRVVGTPCTPILTDGMKTHVPRLQPRSPNPTARARALESEFYWEGWADAEKHLKVSQGGPGSLPR